MFRIFLREKLNTPRKKTESKKPPRRNRRIFERFDVDHKHLTLMNDQDILLIKEISAKGFSTQVSKRSFERFDVGDVYSARMRYLGEIYDLETRVSWKSKKDTVGFELVNSEKKTRDFLQRLLHPIALANSLKKVEANFNKEKQDAKIWYHGDNDTDLYIWTDDGTDMRAWQFISKERFVDWSLNSGLKTGHIAIKEDSVSGILEMSPKSLVQVFDTNINLSGQQFMIDVIMASQVELKDKILSTLTE